MLEWLTELDRQLFLTLNHFRSDWMDPVMLFLSAKNVWIPLYLLIIGLIVYIHRKKAIIYVLCLILSVVAADQLTSRLMKPGFARYRPCHEPALSGQVLTPGKCGGKYGFASSHAANTFAVAAFMFFLFRDRHRYRTILFFWAAIISYSRIYLGVHYPLDILTGAAVGIGCGYLWYKIGLRTVKRLYHPATTY